MPSFKCTLCPRSSLVRSNFKFTPKGICVCVVCWNGYNVARDHPPSMFAVCEELRVDPEAAP